MFKSLVVVFSLFLSTSASILCKTPNPVPVIPVTSLHVCFREVRVCLCVAELDLHNYNIAAIKDLLCTFIVNIKVILYDFSSS